MVKDGKRARATGERPDGAFALSLPSRRVWSELTRTQLVVSREKRSRTASDVSAGLSLKLERLTHTQCPLVPPLPKPL